MSKRRNVVKASYLLLTNPFSAMSRTVAAQGQTVNTPHKCLAFHSTTTCLMEAAAYRKCILAMYMDVHKNSCQQEFENFGQCLRQAVGQKIISLVCLDILYPAYEA